MSILRMKSVTFRHERGPVVLRDASLRIEQRDRIALLGTNGSGKTTLLRLLAGEIAPSDGVVERDTDVRVGYFSQFSTVDDDRSVVALLEERVAATLALEDELAAIEHRLSANPHDSAGLVARQLDLLAEMDAVGGWDVRRRIETVLSRLGFDQVHRLQPVSALSAGWRNRAALAVIVLDAPDVVLFDEPTNYLDIDGVAWLEAWVRALPGAAVIASHDRHFLDQVATRFVEVESAGLDVYEGSLENYIRQRGLRRRSTERRARLEAELWAYELAAIADRREAHRNPSRFLRRRLADAKKARTPPLIDEVMTGLYARLHVGERLGRVEALAKERAGRTLFQDLTFEVGRGDRVGVVGPNGCGKSTLLAVLMGDEAPTHGRVVRPSGVEWVSFESVQHALDQNDSLTHTVNTAPMARTAPRRQVHRFLETLRFSELDLSRRIGELSGGQQARAALAVCLLSGAGVLVADEPTNHLDLLSTQVMERALAHFPGAVIVVSHDRFFLDKVATRLLIFDGKRVDLHEGTWSTWRGSSTDR